MERDIKHITVSNLADGAVDELFQDALGKVLTNIKDLNTDHKGKREILMKFTVTTDEERNVGKITVSCDCKLAGVKGVAVGVYIGQHEGLLVAVEAPRQPDMFPNPRSAPRLVAEAPVSKA